MKKETAIHQAWVMEELIESIEKSDSIKDVEVDFYTNGVINKIKLSKGKVETEKKPMYQYNTSSGW